MLGHVVGLDPSQLLSEGIERHVAVLLVVICPYGRPGGKNNSDAHL